MVWKEAGMTRRAGILGIVACAVLGMALFAGYAGARGPGNGASSSALGARVPRPEPRAMEPIYVTTTTLEVSVDGYCSLIEAILNANEDAAVCEDCREGSGADVIVLERGATYTLLQPYSDTNTGLPGITTTITISGNGAIIQRDMTPGTPDLRILYVGSSGSLALHNLTLRGGQGGTEIWGGAVSNDGGNLSLTDCVVTANSAEWGGGVLNYWGDLRLTHTTVASNTAMAGAGLLNWGGVSVVEDSDLFANAATGYGGGILNYTYPGEPVGTLTLARSTVRDNSVGYYGGGISNQDGILTVTYSTISRNTAVYGGGGISSVAISGSVSVEVDQSLVLQNQATSAVGGGGIFNAAEGGLVAQFTLDRSVVQGNAAGGDTYERGFGGGIYNGFGAYAVGATSLVTLNDSVVAQNLAVNGGGIGNGALRPVGPNAAIITLNRSTVSGNVVGLSPTSQQTGNGGGLFNINGGLVVVNSTVSGNSAQGNPLLTSGLGGGIASAAAGLPATVVFSHTTVANNTAGAGGGLANAYILPVAGFSPARMSFWASLIAANTDLAGMAGCLNNAGAGVATLNSLGYNLESGNTCSLCAPGDITNTNPLLGPLANNGGPLTASGEPAWTHALLPGSRALDAIPLGACALPTDQRGVARPQGSGCDIGAFERALESVYLPLARKH